MLPDFSTQRIEIIKLLCEGKTKVEIAIILGTTEWAVRYHVRVIYRVLQINNYFLLIRWAIKNKIITLETD